MRLSGRKVAVLAANGFEDSELTEPVVALESEGAEVVVVGPDGESGRSVSGKRGTVAALDATIEDVDARSFSAMLIPGGHSPQHLRKDERVLSFVRDMAATKKPIAAICHGPQVLISAGVVEGKIMTSHPSVAPELNEAGATYVDQAVAIDGNFVTSRQPQDIPAFITALMTLFERGSEEAA